MTQQNQPQQNDEQYRIPPGQELYDNDHLYHEDDMRQTKKAAEKRNPGSATQQQTPSPTAKQQPGSAKPDKTDTPEEPED